MPQTRCRRGKREGTESLTRILPENSDRKILTPEAVEMPFDAHLPSQRTMLTPKGKDKA